MGLETSVAHKNAEQPQKTSTIDLGGGGGIEKKEEMQQLKQWNVLFLMK